MTEKEFYISPIYMYSKASKHFMKEICFAIRGNSVGRNTKYFANLKEVNSIKYLQGSKFLSRAVL